MVNLNSTAHDVLSAWRQLLAIGNVDCRAVRPEIAESWLRCKKAGVDASDGVGHCVLESAQIQAMLKKNHRLIEIAKPFMSNLYNFVAGSGFIALLTDDCGYIMEAIGDKAVLTKAASLNFFQGANWTEEEVGTNAIGTGIVLKRPIQVSGPEHYCQKHHEWTCSATPILDSAGKLMAILDLSGPSSGTHLHTLGMVVAAGEAITAQMMVQKKNHELTVTNNRLNNIFCSMSVGVIMVDRLGIIKALNPTAQTILGNKQELLGMMIERVFGRKASFTRKLLDHKQSYTNEEIMVETKQGLIHCLASGEPITDCTGLVTGGVIILQPIQQVQKLVNRFSNYYTTLQFSDIIGDSTPIREAVRVATLAANSNANVLLQGESGVGKEVFAQAIHNQAVTREGPFIAVNCGAIPRELIGSELFGYEEGAFTGAIRGGKPGKFELASGGTLFLDEISDMPLDQQVVLLRVLQDRKVIRIGSNKVIPVNVRVICATNKNLRAEVEKGHFRNDLYYRLNVINITVPPLRDREDDVILLFRYFLDQFGRERGFHYAVEPQVIERLRRYEWPGNVRELHNVIERVVSLAENGEITLAHLPAEMKSLGSKLVEQSPKTVVSVIANRKQSRQHAQAEECRQILALLEQSGGNISVAAKKMGVARSTLYRKLRLYQIDG